MVAQVVAEVLAEVVSHGARVLRRGSGVWGMLAWFGPGWGRYVALAGVILCFICLSICLSLLKRLLEEGPDRLFGDD